MAACSLSGEDSLDRARTWKPRGPYKSGRLEVERVAHFTSVDGKRALEIERQENGFYRWVEWTQFPGDEYIEDYMRPTHFSGIYDTAEAAERDARCLSWLREENSH